MLPDSLVVGVEVREAVAAVDGAGRMQLVLQFATCELQDIMQLVVVEVSGVERPLNGELTFGIPVKGLAFGVEVCASWIFPSAAASRAPE